MAVACELLVLSSCLRVKPKWCRNKCNRVLYASGILLSEILVSKADGIASLSGNFDTWLCTNLFLLAFIA
jgi:hypothetical protein